MLLPLPLLMPFLVAVGWGAIPRCPAQPGNVNADSMAPALPVLSPWMQEQSWDAQTAATERPAPRGWAASPFLGSGQSPPAAPLGPAEQTGDPALHIPLVGPVFLFGQAEKETLLSAQGPRFVGQTGLTWKMPVQPGVELLLSCGPEVTYIDVLRPERLQDRPSLPFQTRLLRVDLQCRWRLLGQLGLECQGSVCPALNGGEQDAFRHDLHLALPLPHGGELHLGAKYYWEKTADVKLGPDSGQLYGDFHLIW